VTVAVCLRCGEFKQGAFVPCPKCGYVPDDDESLTKHLLVTDHYLDIESLEALANRVKEGQPVEFDPESLKAAWVSKAEVDAETRRVGRGCMIAYGAALLAIIGVVAACALWRS
jgi:hypothetical protein